MLKKPDHKPKPVILCILDGWGYAEPGQTNAIYRAKTPNWDRWWKTYPKAFLDTSGMSVGLPEGQMGNSEVGHMNIGGGRVVKQDLPRIDEAISSGKFETHPLFQQTVKVLKRNGGVFHILGLLSPGGVHSHQNHMSVAANLFARKGVPVRIHAFLDGRDVPPKSALEYLSDFETSLENETLISLATVSGRYFAMDRDQRWDRVEKAFQAIQEGNGVEVKTGRNAIERGYEKGETDEFITPSVVSGFQGMKDGDALLMANFRADRAREILTALVDPNFEGFKRPRTVQFSSKLGMVEYSDALNKYVKALYPPFEVKHSLGEVVSNAGLTQLRIAETEKYAHVTFFFNGGQEKTFPGEDRILIPSPKVATYDLKPEMSAFELTENLIREIKSGNHDLIVVNFANPDMVGHTGNLEAAMKAVQVIDTCLGSLERALKGAGGVMLLSADHGNIEQMSDPDTNGPHTAHTTFVVPVVFIDPAGMEQNITGLENGKLADLAPSVLDLLDLPKPDVMTGHSLFIRKDLP